MGGEWNMLSWLILKANKFLAWPMIQQVLCEGAQFALTTKQWKSYFLNLYFSKEETEAQRDDPSQIVLGGRERNKSQACLSTKPMLFLWHPIRNV